jgi:hypothetical protein
VIILNGLAVILFFNPPGKIHVFPAGIGVFSPALPEETTMSKHDKKSFYRYVNSASERELEFKLLQLQSLLIKLKEPETISEAEWMIREISLELDARRDMH